MAEPFLHLRDVRLVLEGVGRGGGAQRVHADRDAEWLRVPAAASRPDLISVGYRVNSELRTNVDGIDMMEWVGPTDG